MLPKDSLSNEILMGASELETDFRFQASRQSGHWFAAWVASQMLEPAFRRAGAWYAVVALLRRTRSPSIGKSQLAWLVLGVAVGSGMACGGEAGGDPAGGAGADGSADADARAGVDSASAAGSGGGGSEAAAASGGGGTSLDAAVGEKALLLARNTAWARAAKLAPRRWGSRSPSRACRPQAAVTGGVRGTPWSARSRVASDGASDDSAHHHSERRRHGTIQLDRSIREYARNVGRGAPVPQTRPLHSVTFAGVVAWGSCVLGLAEVFWNAGTP
jgi:hypothetical protein